MSLEEFAAYGFTGGNGVDKNFPQFLDRPLRLLIIMFLCLALWLALFERGTGWGTNLAFTLRGLVHAALGNLSCCVAGC